MAKSSRGFIRYKSYLFISKDPIIDALRTGVSDSKMSYSEITDGGGPATATLRNWFNGTTKRPQFATVAATARTIGKKGIRFTASGNPYLID
jgi:hypothetical protein